jgi:unsaturated rhamnogalacturonyl hydrolase
MLMQYYEMTSTADPAPAEAAYAIGLMKDWFAQRYDEGVPTKNINTMAVMYSVACLVELDEQRQRTVLNDEWRLRFSEWIDEWAEWIMNELPSMSTACMS